jgi:hypothetical protein
LYLDPLNTGATCLETYCPEQESNDDPNTGGGGGFSSCYSLGGEGMEINGNTEEAEIPCIDVSEEYTHIDQYTYNNIETISNIILTPLNSNSNYYHHCKWGMKYINKEFVGSNNINNMPSYLDKNKCYTHYPFYNFFIKTCDCVYYKNFISIYEVDENLNIMGQEYTKEIYRQIYYANQPNITVNCAIGYFCADNISLSLSELESSGIQFVPGHYYRLKLVLNPSSGWTEDIRYFRYYKDELSINNNIFDNLSANKITIENATITNNYIVSAYNKIEILPNTIIESGTYKIDNKNCYDTENSKIYTIEEPEFVNYICDCGVGAKKLTIENDSVENNTNRYSETKKLEEKKSNNIKIYPNPNNGSFNVKVSDNSEIKSLKIYDLSGRKVLEKIVNNNNISIPNAQNGMYFIEIQLDEDTVFEKIIIE